MSRRIFVGALVAVFGFSVSALGQTRSSGTDAGALGGRLPPKVRSTISPVEQLLAKTVESVSWDEAPFEEVITWLRDASDGKVNVVPRWSALEVEDVNPDRTVTLELGGVSIGTILTEVLDQLSETGEVTYRGSGNTLRLSTKQDFNRKMEVRLYDVTDILFRLPDFSESAPQIDLQQQSGGAQSGGGGSQPIFRGAGGQGQEELSEEGEQDPQQILDDLATLIRDTIAPDTWSEGDQGGGGGLGVIRGFNKRVLVVRNTVEVHEMIAGYFSLDQ